MNAARALGPALVQQDFTNWWIYWSTDHRRIACRLCAQDVLAQRQSGPSTRPALSSESVA